MKYIGSKELETERLILHKTEEKDLKELWNILLLDEVSQYYLTTKINTDWEEEKVWQYKKLDNASNDDVFTWTIETKKDNAVIGQISIVDTEEENIKDIGWFLDPTYQKNGYCMEAAEAVIKYMFLEAEITGIDTCAAIENPSSWHLMEKLGFKRSKELKEIKYTKQDNPTKCYIYTLNKKDFLKECFRRESLYITENIDKDPYIKHLSDDLVLNITGESGSGKSTATEPYKNDLNCIIVDTDKIFGKNRDEDNELYKMFVNKYKTLPNLYNDFDIIYKDILDYYKYSEKMLIIDSAQFRNLKDLTLLKGDIIVIRTCINTCYERCINRFNEKHPEATFESLAEYQSRKKEMYNWYHSLNDFLYKLDRKD